MATKGHTDDGRNGREILGHPIETIDQPLGGELFCSIVEWRDSAVFTSVDSEGNVKVTISPEPGVNLDERGRRF